MSGRRRRSSYDGHSAEPIIIERSPKLYDFFSPRKRTVVIRQTPVHRRRQERRERSRSPPPTPPPSPPRGPNHIMSSRLRTKTYVPLPPEITSRSRQEHYEHHDDREPIYEVRSPRDSRPELHHYDPHFDSDHEFVEPAPSPPRRADTRSQGYMRSYESSPRRTQQTTSLLNEALASANHNYHAAMEARNFHDADVENLTRQFNRTVINQQAATTQAQLRAQQLQRELEDEKRQRKRDQLAQRENALADREARLRQRERDQRRAEDGPPNRGNAVVVQDLRPVRTGDPATDALNRAGEDYINQTQRRQDDDALHGQQRDRQRGLVGRRGSMTTYDDADARRGHRRR